MNRFVIYGGLPYLLSHGDIFTVRLEKVGFTVGEKAQLPEIPAVAYSELSVRAKCKTLSSIQEPETSGEQAEQSEPETEQAEQPKKTARTRRKAVQKDDHDG